MAQILSDLARPMQSSMVSPAIPLESWPNDLDDFSVPQVDFDVVTDCKSFQMGNHKPQDPQAILAQVELLTKLMELL